MRIVSLAGLLVNCMCFYLVLTNRKNVCFENKLFVDKQRYKGDRSVGYSIYMNITMGEYEKSYSITELEYSKEVKALAGRPVCEPIFSLGSELMKSLNIPLQTSIGEGRENDFVLYAAIDLMGAMYNREFPEDTVLILVFFY